MAMRFDADDASTNPPTTTRTRQKADRRRALLNAAATLFAERGYSGVTLEDLGSAAGVSGPAVYRHFAGKSAVLHAILHEASQTLLDGAQAVLDDTSDAASALHSLIAHHVDFAVGDADIIIVQDRELDHLEASARHAVRLLQRRYVELWVGVLSQLRADRTEVELRFRAHAAFGLMNSTPHSVRLPGELPANSTVRGVLESMAWASLMS